MRCCTPTITLFPIGGKQLGHAADCVHKPGSMVIIGDDQWLPYTALATWMRHDPGCKCRPCQYIEAHVDDHDALRGESIA